MAAHGSIRPFGRSSALGSHYRGSSDEVLRKDARAQSETVRALLHLQRRAGRKPEGGESLGFDPESGRVAIAPERLQGDELLNSRKA